MIADEGARQHHDTTVVLARVAIGAAEDLAAALKEFHARDRRFGALAAAVAASILPLPAALRVAVYFLFALIVWRHRPNIARIARGQEHRLGQHG